MGTLLEALRWAQAAVFVSLAVAGLRVWHAHRSRPAAYVAAAFGTLGVVSLSARLQGLFGVDDLEILGDLTLALLLAFPWLLAAAAWSFQGRLPRWLQLGAVAVAGVAVWGLVVPPLPDAPPRLVNAHLGTVAAVWLLLTSAAAGHLWWAGRGARLIADRTRLLAIGALVLTIALLGTLATVTAEAATGWQAAFAALTIAAGALFGAGFAPPAPLRWWWRQLPRRRMTEMQTALLAAATPDEVAEAVSPVVAEVFGGGAVVTDGRRVRAASGVPGDEARSIAARLARGDDPGDGVVAVDAQGWWLAVHASPYAPLFGDLERDLLERYAVSLSLAVQRAELFEAHAEARAQVEQASRELEAVLVGLAHDLRSPAVTISSYTALLRQARDDADREQMIDGIRESSVYLDRLVDGLVQLSRAGRTSGRPEVVALGAVVEGATRRLSARYPQLRVEVTEPLPTVRVDRLRIEQMVDNLLGNAAKHGGRPDVTVRIGWTPTETGGCLHVTDDGRGIPLEEHDAVFGLFRRGSGSRGAGSGVGLGLVRRIVESFDGRIRLEPSDTGARFRIDLPAHVLVDPVRAAGEQVGPPRVADGQPDRPDDAAAPSRR